MLVTLDILYIYIRHALQLKLLKFKFDLKSVFKFALKSINQLTRLEFNRLNLNGRFMENSTWHARRKYLRDLYTTYDWI